MSIQDWILAACQWLFLVALVPSLLSDRKPAGGTSLMTGIICGVMAITFSTLALWASAISTALVAIGWLVLAYQSAMRWNRERRYIQI